MRLAFGRARQCGGMEWLLCHPSLGADEVSRRRCCVVLQVTSLFRSKHWQCKRRKQLIELSIGAKALTTHCHRVSPPCAYGLHTETIGAVRFAQRNGS